MHFGRKILEDPFPLSYYNIDARYIIDVTSQSYSVTIHCTNSTPFDIKVRSYYSVKRMKDVIRDIKGQHRNQQRLFFHGAELNNYQWLYEYKIKWGSHIQLLLRSVDNPFQIEVRTASRKSLHTTIRPTDTIEMLKTIIEDKWGMETQSQLLKFGDIELENSHTFKNYNIKRNSSLSVVARPTPLFTIHVKDRYSTTHTLHVARMDTVHDIKLKLAGNLKTFAANQTIRFCSRDLENERTLHDYNICNEYVLHVIDESYTIYIVLPNAVSFPVVVRSNNSVKYIKCAVMTIKKIYPEEQRLLVMAKELRDDMLLYDAGIMEETYVVLSLELQSHIPSLLEIPMSYNLEMKQLIMDLNEFSVLYQRKAMNHVFNCPELYEEVVMAKKALSALVSKINCISDNESMDNINKSLDDVKGMKGFVDPSMKSGLNANAVEFKPANSISFVNMRLSADIEEFFISNNQSLEIAQNVKEETLVLIKDKLCDIAGEGEWGKLDEDHDVDADAEKHRKGSKGADWSVFVFGSESWVLRSKFSDTDCGIMLPFTTDIHQKRRLLRELMKKMTAEGIQCISLLHAKYPVVRIKNRKKYQFDVSIADEYCLKTQQIISDILNGFESRHIPVRALIVFIKYWAKRRGINNAFKCYLNSFGYTILTIHYLQFVCQSTTPGFNQTDLSYLAVGFFSFYLHHFDMTKCSIQIVSFGDKTEYDCSTFHKKVNDNCLIEIIDPANCDNNIAKNVGYNEHYRIGRELRRAYNICNLNVVKQYPEPRSLFEKLTAYHSHYASSTLFMYS